MAVNTIRECKNCGKDISKRHKPAIRCEDCQYEFRLEYKRPYIHRYRAKALLKPGSNNPFVIDTHKCGNNRYNKFPRYKKPWMAFWQSRQDGMPEDMHTVRRERALRNLTQRQSNYDKEHPEPNDGIIHKKRTLAEVYDRWDY